MKDQCLSFQYDPHNRKCHIDRHEILTSHNCPGQVAIFKDLIDSEKKEKNKWIPLFSRGTYGDQALSGRVFNQKIYSMADQSPNKMPIIKRDCAECVGSHKEIYYKRRTSTKSANYYHNLLLTWTDSQNKMHKDFDIYSSLDDAVNNRNPWMWCNFNDGGVAFPRDCGPRRHTGGQWSSLTRGGIRSYRFSVYHGN